MPTNLGAMVRPSMREVFAGFPTSNKTLMFDRVCEETSIMLKIA
jgi:hypothetical protein